MGLANKVVALGLTSIVLVAVVVAVVVVTKKDGDNDKGSGGGEVHTSNKAINALCQPTDYKDACVKSLSTSDSTDPKTLIKAGFESAQKEINDVISRSKTLQDAAKDQSTKESYGLCKRLLETSIDDFKRSIDRIGSINAENMKKFVADLRTWLSGASNYQSTCIDAFQNTTGDAADKMKDLLKSSRELSSNALAMVTELTKIFDSLNLKSVGTRRLSSIDNELPEWISAHQRRLLQDSITPNAVVAQDGSGQFKTIGDAIKTVPANNAKPFVIQVKAGVYNEVVRIPRRTDNVIMIGEGATKTKITGSKNFIDGVRTFETATVGIDGDLFMARDIGFENSAGAAKHQAVALRVSGDKAVFFQCQMDGFQDTLYNHNYRQYYRDCTISGTIDFIFGDSASIFQNCKMIVNKPMDNQSCMVTAQGRDNSRSTGGNVLQNCTITGDPALSPATKSYLGRPWKEFSRTVIMQSSIDSLIVPEGWAPWGGDFGLATSYYLEYQNRGPGSDTSKRVNWPGIVKNMNDADIQQFTAINFIQADQWVPATNVPIENGMMKV
ncbi:Pectinesterase [Heracleum sosnowskyi]|uniref:Pectinesterase n=1 Tax=Heracleum sosnowskyi TaxID=360622 RepID=A0AAD8MUI4_9APIA|nr:Pectinesterase [Heracleum sosnowskyi]